MSDPQQSQDSTVMPRPTRFLNVGEAAAGGLRVGLTTGLRLLLIMLPTGFAVFVLDLFGVLQPLAILLDPVMGLAGLPGKAALVFVTSALVSIYPAIAVMTTITLSAAQTAVMAVMILVCHNLFVETAIQTKVGSNPVRIVLLRVVGSFGLGVVLARLFNLPRAAGDSRALAGTFGAPGWDRAAAAFLEWTQQAGEMSLRVVVIVILLMVGQRILEYWGVQRRVARGFGPVVAFLGLPRSTAFLWIVANTLGLAYGAAVIIEERRIGHVSRREADVLNHHLALSHSLLEDTLIFVALGVAPLVLIVPRLASAMIVVWVLQLLQHISGIYGRRSGLSGSGY